MFDKKKITNVVVTNKMVTITVVTLYGEDITSNELQCVLPNISDYPLMDSTLDNMLVDDELNQHYMYGLDGGDGVYIALTNGTTVCTWVNGYPVMREYDPKAMAPISGEDGEFIPDDMDILGKLKEIFKVA